MPTVLRSGKNFLWLFEQTIKIYPFESATKVLLHFTQFFKILITTRRGKLPNYYPKTRNDRAIVNIMKILSFKTLPRISSNFFTFWLKTNISIGWCCARSCVMMKKNQIQELACNEINDFDPFRSNVHRLWKFVKRFHRIFKNCWNFSVNALEIRKSHDESLTTNFEVIIRIFFYSSYVKVLQQTVLWALELVFIINFMKFRGHEPPLRVSTLNNFMSAVYRNMNLNK